ncbi:MAG: hypothetical protein DRH57_04455 [Candidatus Cloacimonadota bacterium]|nr:MAG: hypothetical protein DRH57_04455 [Candidatus Cloacimonadota bacterium]
MDKTTLQTFLNNNHLPYTVISLVHKTEHHSIYKVKNLITQKIEILKWLSKTDLDSIKRIRNEYNILTYLDFPTLPKASRLFYIKEGIFFTQEYCPGKALTTFANGQEENIICEIAGKIILTFAYLHSQQIIYRDVKPSNILVSSDGKIKIVDFNLAVKSREIGESPDTHGTIGYLAPEIINGEKPSFQSDIYAVGVLLTEMLSGRNPFLCDSIEDTIDAHLNLDFEMHCPEWQKLTHQWQNILKKNLRKNPKYRYNSFLQMYEEYQKAFPEQASNLTDWYLRNLSNSLPVYFASKNVIKDFQRRNSHYKIISSSSIEMSEKALQQLRPKLESEGVFIYHIFPPSKHDALQFFYKIVKDILLLADLEKSKREKINSLLNAFIEQETKEKEKQFYENYIVDLFAELLGYLPKNCMIFIHRLNELPTKILNTLVEKIDGSHQNKKQSIIFSLSQNASNSKDIIANIYRLSSQSISENLIQIEDYTLEQIQTILKDKFNISKEASYKVGEKLSEASDGNYLILSESLKQILNSKYFHLTNGEWQCDYRKLFKYIGTSKYIGIASLQAFYQEKIDKLSADEREVLELVACYNEPFNLEILSKMSKQDLPKISRIVYNLIQKNCLISAEKEIKFTSNIFADFVRTTATTLEGRSTSLKKYYQLIAEYLSSQPKISNEEHFTIANFWEKAGNLSEAKRHYFCINYDDTLLDNQLLNSIWRRMFSWKILSDDDRIIIIRKIINTELSMRNYKNFKEDLETFKKLVSKSPHKELNAEIAFIEFYYYLFGLNDFDNVTKLSPEVIKICKEFNSNEFLSKTYLVLYLKSFWEGNYIEAEKYIKSAYRVSSKYRITSATILSLRYIGQLYLRMHNTKKAEKFFKKLYEYYEQNPKGIFQDYTINIHKQWSKISCYKYKDIQEALSECDKGYKMAEEVFLNDYQLQFIILKLSILIDNNNYRTALSIFPIAYSLKLNIYYELALLELKISLFIGLGLFDSAIPEIKQTLEISEKHRYFLTYINTLQKWGKILGENDFSQARDKLKKAKDIAKQIKNKHAEYSIILQEIDMLQREKRYNKAINLCKTLIEESEQIHNQSLLAKIYSTYGYLLMLRNQLKDALTYSQKSLNIIKRRDVSKSEIERIYYYHYLILRCSKNTDFVEKGREYLKCALDALIFKLDQLNEPEEKEHLLLLHLPSRIWASALQENLIQTKYDFNRSLSAIRNILTATNNLPHLLDEIIISIKNLTGAERSLIALKQDEKITIAAPRTHKDKWQREISFGIIEKVISTSNPVFTIHASNEEAFRKHESIISLQISSIICVPLKSGRKSIGAIYLDASRVNAFSSQDYLFCQSFANIAGIAINRLKHLKKLRDENIYLREEIGKKYDFDSLIGNSPAFRQTLELVSMVIPTEVSVLLSGETGTGKELIARAIHFNGPRRDKKFVTIDCGNLPDTILESELFGHIKGAFTDAIEDKKGLFQEADGGTIFLDEIENLSPGFQQKLLRVLQFNEIRKVGSTQVIPIDVRIISATNHDLQELVKNGLFREDLFFRINVFQITIPPLRERENDVLLLAEFFLKQITTKMNKKVKGLTKESKIQLLKNEWKGNVRELQNVIERAVIMAEKNSYIGPGLLNLQEQTTALSIENLIDYEGSYNEMVDKFKLKIIESALQQNSYNKSAAARRLGMSVQNFNQIYSRLKRKG